MCIRDRDGFRYPFRVIHPAVNHTGVVSSAPHARGIRKPPVKQSRVSQEPYEQHYVPTPEVRMCSETASASTGVNLPYESPQHSDMMKEAATAAPVEQGHTRLARGTRQN